MSTRSRTVECLSNGRGRLAVASLAVLCAGLAFGQAVPVDDAVSREVALRVDPAASFATPALVDDTVSREFIMFVNGNDANGNGISDLLESTLVTTVLSAANISAPKSSWVNTSAAVGAPACAESCPCSAGSDPGAANGADGVSPNNEYLVAAFGAIQLPDNRVVSSVTADVMCRFDDAASGEVEILIASGSTQLLLASQTFTSGEECAYRFGGAGRLIAPPPGGWTQEVLSGLSVALRRAGDNGSALRVKAFRLTVTTVERDDDGDGIADTVDNCPTVSNPLQQDCDGNGVGDACELKLFPERDANQNGVVDACEGVAGWIGGESGAFNDPANWSSGTVPGPSTDLFLRGVPGSVFDVVTTAPVAVNSLVVTGGTVGLQVGGTFRVNGLFTVSSGATLSVEAIGGPTTLELAGFSQIRGGGRLEILPTAVVRCLASGSFSAQPLSNISFTLRPDEAVPLQTLGPTSLLGGIAVRLGVFAAGDLTVGTRFTLITAANLGTGFFSTLSAQGLETKFLRVVQASGFSGGSLILEVAELQQFVQDAGGSNQTVGIGEEPTAIVARNFTSGFDVFDDIAVTVRRSNGQGGQLDGNLYVFRGDGTGGISEQAVYVTRREPIAVESVDIDDDGSFDIVVLCRTSGELQIFLNPSRTVSGFVEGDRKPVGVGSTFFAITRALDGALQEPLVGNWFALISNPSGTVLVPARIVGGVIVPLPTLPVPTPTGPVSPIDDTGRQESAFLAAATAGPGDEYGLVSKVIIAPNGSAGFGASVLGPAQPLQIEAGEFNSDGFPDMVVTGLSSPEFGAVPSVNIYPGTSVGFATGGAIPLTRRPLGLAIGEFTGDSRRDFVVALGTVDEGVESGEFVRRFNNVTEGGSSPVFESGANDVLFAGQGVRRIRRSDLNGVAPDDCAVLGETIPADEGASFFGGLVGYGGARIFLLTPQPSCIGDINDDGVVDSFDLTALCSAWGGVGEADLDGSKVVDGFDLALLLAAWGPCEGPE